MIIIIPEVLIKADDLFSRLAIIILILVREIYPLTFF